MANYTFQHISIFTQSSAAEQLKALVEFVLETPAKFVYPTDVERFNARLLLYAKGSHLTEEEARKNVRVEAEKQVKERTAAFSLFEGDSP